MVRVRPLDVQIDPMRCMGDWYVQVAIPTPFDKTACNGLEQYVFDEAKQQVGVCTTHGSAHCHTVYHRSTAEPLHHVWYRSA